MGRLKKLLHRNRQWKRNLADIVIKRMSPDQIDHEIKDKLGHILGGLEEKIRQ
ncbi:hypothetical protein M1O51_00865 [Dehalococcoidia bacterium]|nr:hypothetical protein [Dehalococcoidia bacterium]